MSVCEIEVLKEESVNLNIEPSEIHQMAQYFDYSLQNSNFNSRSHCHISHRCCFVSVSAPHQDLL